MDLKFSYSPKDVRGIEWVIAEFGHGPRPRSLKADEEDNGRSLQLRLTSSSSGIEAHLDHSEAKVSYRGSAAKKDAARYLVAVVDRKKRTAQILPEESGLEVSMVPHVKGFVPVQPEDHDDVNLGTYVREFASHREHKRLKEYSDAYISANSLNVVSEMNNARAAHKADLEAIKKRLEDDQSDRPLVPKHDKETIVPATVYTIDSLVPRPVQGVLLELVESRFGEALVSEEAEVLLAAIDSCDISLREFVEQSILEIHKVDGDEEEKKQRTLAFGFVLAMQCFLLAEHPIRREDKIKSHVFDQQVILFKKICRHLDDLFGSKATSSNRTVLDAAARIRCFNYAMVGMLLSSSNSSVKVDHVCSLFGVVPAIAKRHLSGVGCKLIKTDPPSSKTNIVFALTAPVKFPSMAQKGKRK